jgi:hypothetical protein
LDVIKSDKAASVNVSEPAWNCLQTESAKKWRFRKGKEERRKKEYDNEKSRDIPPRKDASREAERALVVAMLLVGKRTAGDLPL